MYKTNRLSQREEGKQWLSEFLILPKSICVLLGASGLSESKVCSSTSPHSLKCKFTCTRIIIRNIGKISFFNYFL